MRCLPEKVVSRHPMQRLWLMYTEGTSYGGVIRMEESSDGIVNYITRAVGRLSAAADPATGLFTR